MPVNCGHTELAEELQEVIKEAQFLGRAHERVAEAPSRAWHRLTQGWRSIEAALTETSLVRITQGASRELANQLRGLLTATRALRVQAMSVVRRAANMYMSHIGAGGDGEGLIRHVERIGREVSGDKNLKFHHRASTKVVRTLSKYYDGGRSYFGALLDLISIGLFGKVGGAPEIVAHYIRVVKDLGGDETTARYIWEKHGDLFATGATRKGRQITIGETKMRSDEFAAKVLERLEKDENVVNAAGAWLGRVSELKAESVAFPGGAGAAFDRVLGTVAPEVAKKAKSAYYFIDREGWNPQYQERMTVGGALVNALMLGGLPTSVVQLGAFITTIADIGLARFALGVMSAVKHIGTFFGRGDESPEDIAIALAIQEGGGGVGGLATPLLSVSDRITRFTAAVAAVNDFKAILGRLRSKYAGQETLPTSGDADIDRLRFLGFNDSHILQMVNSTVPVPRLGLAFYVSRATNLGIGAPDALNAPPITKNILWKLVFPFSRFAVTMGSNVHRRLFKDAAIRNYMESKKVGSDPEEIGFALASFVKTVKDVDYRYFIALLSGSVLYDHYIVDSANDALGAVGDDETSLERINEAWADAIRTGQITPEDVQRAIGAVWQALDSVGALGVTFSAWSRNLESGDKPVDAALEEAISRSPTVRIASLGEQTLKFLYAAAKNAGAQTSEEFWVGVARDMPQPGGAFLGEAQAAQLEAMLSVSTKETREITLDYLRQQTQGKILSRLYAMPLVRNDYIIAMHVNTEHHNKLLIDSLIRARVMDASHSGAKLVAPGPPAPGETNDVVPGLSEKWKTRAVAVAMIESVLMGRYGYKTRAELYRNLILPEAVKQQSGALLPKAAQQVEEFRTGNVPRAVPEWGVTQPQIRPKNPVE